MLSFRARFAVRRLFSPGYSRRLAQILVHPFKFYGVLASKLLPGLSKRPFDLRLKDGAIVRVYGFWALFLFDEIFVENCYESPEVLKCSPFGTVIDIGANIGLFTLRSKQLWPEARVIALEPHPGNFRRLKEHVGINHLQDVEPMQVGIAERPGCFDLYCSPRNIGGHSMYKHDSDAPSISITTCTLPDVMSKVRGRGGDTLLKIDCEGCEYPLLSTMSQEVADQISCIVFEPERSLYDLEALTKKLTSLGFKISYYSSLVVAAKALTMKA